VNVTLIVLCKRCDIRRVHFSSRSSWRNIQFCSVSRHE
jgi:hypothetical protein